MRISIAGAIWSNKMPDELTKHLPFLNATEIADIYGSIVVAAQEPIDSPVRQGVIAGTSSSESSLLRIVC